MRADSRLKILETAARIVEADGVTGLTFDALAAETGLSRAGVTYHFHARDDLLFALNEYMAAEWRRSLEATIASRK